ncbi:MAG: wax ester/triacylglycerol synthase family O-acyltransferase [Acidimicrobiales bacterium]|nr:wax ester/triacylglycerol synthase family O-acyltransferase [Acidimicrobiales bacterium]
MIEQLSGVDTSFLTMEVGTNAVGHVTGVLIIDPTTSPEPWTFERFSQHLISRVGHLPPFRRCLREVPLGLDRPYWVSKTEVDFDYHLRHVAVPGLGGRQEFAELVARIHSRPLDRTRPLWECYVVDKVHGDRVGIITKIHHAAIDGISGQEILSQLVDLSPDVEVREPVRYLNPEPTVSPEDLTRRALRAFALSPTRVARTAWALGKALPLFGPAFTKSQGKGTVESLRELAAPRTPFNASIGPHRRWSYVSVRLDDVKEVKNAAGTTVNDVVLAITSGVLRRWLQRHDALPERDLLAMVPLSVRSSSEAHAIGNQVSFTIANLATTELDPATRLKSIHLAMIDAKASHDTLPAHILTDISQVAPPAISALASRLIASTNLADRVTLPFNVVVSNVPGPPVPLYISGAEVLGNYPVSAIVDGVGLNVTVVSTNNMLDFGFVSDRDLIPDLWNMADDVLPALNELKAAYGLPLSGRARLTTTEEAITARQRKAAAKNRASAKRNASKRRSAAKAALARESAATKAPTKLAAATKAPVKRAAAKKAPAKKRSASTASARNASAKKTPAKKTSAKKTSVKRTSAKKTPAKKTPAKKAPAKKT